MKLNLENRAVGLGKAAVCTVGCGVTVAFYPAVLTVAVTAACVLIPLAVATSVSSSYSHRNNADLSIILGVCAGIAASPALFAGEAALGVGQAVSGKKMSLMYLPGGSVFNPDDTKYNNSILADKNVGNKIPSLDHNAKVASVAISAPPKSPVIKTPAKAMASSSSVAPFKDTLANHNNAATSMPSVLAPSITNSENRELKKTPSFITPNINGIPKESLNITQIYISKEKEEVKNLGKQIRQDRIDRIKKLLKGNVSEFMNGGKRQELLDQQISKKKNIHNKKLGVRSV